MNIVDHSAKVYGQPDFVEAIARVVGNRKVMVLAFGEQAEQGSLSERHSPRNESFVRQTLRILACSQGLCREVESIAPVSVAHAANHSFELVAKGEEHTWQLRQVTAGLVVAVGIHSDVLAFHDV